MNSCAAGRWHHALGRRALLKIVTLIVTALTSSGISPSLAMPPHPSLEARIRAGEIQPPPTLLEPDALWDAALRRPRGAPVIAAPAQDTFRTLAILIEYSDRAASVPAGDFDTLLYAQGNGSVRDFYLEVSYGRLDMVTVHLPSATGWQTAPQTGDYYANGEYGLGTSSYPRNARRLVEEAVAAADPSVDFSLYDNDGDGRVDALMIVHAGPGAEFSGNVNHIWSHKWGISQQLRDDVWVSGYAMMPEYWSSPGDITVGVFVHELGHVLGLPDLYDTDYSSRGVGRWSTMANGAWNGTLGDSPAHLDAWCKMQLGFLTPVTPTTQVQGAQFPQVETDTLVYRLWDAGAAGDEYFLVENRQRVGFDLRLPTAGLLIWHIYESVTTDNDKEWYPGYTSSGHYLVAVEQADGNFDLEKNTNSGDSGDPFPGQTNRRTFNSTTMPGSLAYDGSVSYVIISNISNSGSLMTADLTVSLVSDVEEEGVLPESPALVRNYPNPFNGETRIEVRLERPGSIRLEICDVMGRTVRRPAAQTVQAGVWQMNWDGRDDRGRGLASGVYWCRLHTDDGTVTRKMLMLK